MPKDPKDKHLDKLQQTKRRTSPTANTIRKALKEKYPIGFSTKPTKGK